MLQSLPALFPQLIVVWLVLADVILLLHFPHGRPQQFYRQPCQQSFLEVLHLQVIGGIQHLLKQHQMVGSVKEAQDHLSIRLLHDVLEVLVAVERVMYLVGAAFGVQFHESEGVLEDFAVELNEADFVFGALALEKTSDENRVLHEEGVEDFEFAIVLGDEGLELVLGPFLSRRHLGNFLLPAHHQTINIMSVY